MRISRVAIKNFRNFHSIDLVLADHAVIVGANAVGKSNFLHALRLVLDPSLPDSLRVLRREDIWDGVPRPLPKSLRVEVIIELTDFEDSDEQLASLAEHLIEPSPMVVRLTYVFTAKSNAPDPPGPDDFEFFVFGGDREDNRIGYELRRRLPLDLFHALRDVESDLTSWRRSPLRPLLERAWAKVSTLEKQTLADGVQQAAAAVTTKPSLTELATTLADTLAAHAGDALTTDIQLGIAPTEPEALIRVIRLLFDGGQRGVTDASLGLANVLYLTLKLLELQHLVSEEHERDHTFVAIEEPEAHLHPHLQRQMFRAFLRIRPHLPTGTEDVLQALPTTILLTTHSPHLASIAPLRSAVLLRQVWVTLQGGKRVSTTRGFSMAGATLQPAEIDDLERYLEVTRAEMLFARGVLLVEGDSESYLVPRIAELHGVDLNKLGITTCAIGGTYFRSYVTFLKCLGIPFAVLTDGDPNEVSSGTTRVLRLLQFLIGKSKYDAIPEDARLKKANALGLFVGEETFELDLLNAGRTRSIPKALSTLATTQSALKCAFRSSGSAVSPWGSRVPGSGSRGGGAELGSVSGFDDGVLSGVISR